MFEDGFTEEDEAWDPVDRETDEQIEARARLVLNEIFEEEDDTCRLSRQEFQVHKRRISNYLIASSDFYYFPWRIH